MTQKSENKLIKSLNSIFTTESKMIHFLISMPNTNQQIEPS
jgi:hypothetical protein